MPFKGSEMFRSQMPIQIIDGDIVDKKIEISVAANTLKDFIDLSNNIIKNWTILIQRGAWAY